jgi:biotin carboxyl carrier protein
VSVRRYLARIGTTEVDIEVARAGAAWVVRVAGEERQVEVREGGASIVLTTGGRTLEAVVVREAERAGATGTGERRFAVTIGAQVYAVVLENPLRRTASDATREPGGPVQVRSIMPGRIASLLAREGEAVRAGQGILVVEAMKMENEIQAPKDGRVVSLGVRSGDTVEVGVVLFTVE